MTADLAQASAPEADDDDIKDAILEYKKLRDRVEELEKKVADADKRVAALLDGHKVKQLLKDIISQPQ